MLTHPTLDQLRALNLDGHGPGLHRARSAREARNLAHAEWLALLLDREAADRGTRRFHTRLRAARCAPRRRSRTSTTARPAGSTRRCSSSWPPAAGSPSTAACCHRAVRRGQVGVLLCAGAEGLSRRLHRPLRPRAAPVRRSRSRPRRRPLRAAVPHADQGRSPRPRRLGSRSASPPASGAISWRSSRIATAVAPC